VIIDAHVHVFSPDAIAERSRLVRLEPYFACLYQSPQARMATVEDLVEQMNEAGVDMAVVSGFGWNDPVICRDHNAYLIDAVRRYPDRLIGLATANPRQRRHAERDLVAALEAGLGGIGELMPDGARYSLADSGVRDFLADLARTFSVPLLVHVSEPVGHQYPGKGTVWPAQVVTWAEQHPDITIVCAHWGGGLPFYELMPEVETTLKNVYYDTAAWPFLYDDRIFLAAVHMVPGKVLYATDYPLLSETKTLSRIRSLGLPSFTEAGVLGDNARRVYCRGVVQ